MAQFRQQMKKIMQMAWQFVKRNGYTMAKSLKVAWANFKLKVAMKTRIVHFWFQKIDGSIREAFGTLADGKISAISGTDNRQHNETVQVFFDTEKQGWRCFKKANFISFVSEAK